MAVVNGSVRGEIRGIAMPLLLDLARKPVFLHDNSVPNLERLLAGGGDAPHPFYLNDSKDRQDLIAFLKSMDTEATPGNSGCDTPGSVLANLSIRVHWTNRICFSKNNTSNFTSRTPSNLQRHRVST